MSINTAKILIISPIRNEGKFIQKTIDSLINQTLLPVEWIIVDDGSSDNTWELIRDLPKKYPWIQTIRRKDRGVRAVGPGVVEAFYFGYEYIRNNDYDFICKMDGDLEFPNTYFEKLSSYFEKDKKLGAASGKIFLRINGKLVEERISNEMVSGAFNFYRKECFEAIGGFVREVHWDGIAFHKARMCGWRTRSINDSQMNFIHLRLMGSSHKSIIHGRLRWGKGQYFLGTHPLYLLCIGLYRALERPYIIGGFLIVFGYLRAAFKKMPRYDYPGFRKSLHAWQLEKLKLSKRLEYIPES